VPTNKSSNKVRVQRTPGTDSTLGFADPKVDMSVRHGIDSRWIVSLDSGNLQVGLAATSGGAVLGKAYPHELTVTSGVASYFGWPTGAGGVTQGHGPQITLGTEAPKTGVYLRGDGTPVAFTVGQ
jgi:hypothetical protein